MKCKKCGTGIRMDEHCGQICVYCIDKDRDRLAAELAECKSQLAALREAAEDMLGAVETESHPENGKSYRVLRDLLRTGTDYQSGNDAEETAKLDALRRSHERILATNAHLSEQLSERSQQLAAMTAERNAQRRTTDVVTSIERHLRTQLAALWDAADLVCKNDAEYQRVVREDEVQPDAPHILKDKLFESIKSLTSLLLRTGMDTGKKEPSKFCRRCGNLAKHVCHDGRYFPDSHMFIPDTGKAGEVKP